MSKSMYERMAADVQGARPGLSLAQVAERPMLLVELIKIADIKIGKRHRRDLGDVQALADSINEVGLLHPPVVSDTAYSLPGERRIQACKILGWTEIPVRRLDLADLVRGEYAENAIRKDFTPSEAVAIAKALKPYEKKAAAERQAATRLSGEGKFPSPGISRKKGKTLDKVAAAVGLSGKTLKKAEEVVESGRTELVEEMDRTGKIDPVHRKLRKKDRPAKAPAAKPARKGHHCCGVHPY